MYNNSIIIKLKTFKVIPNCIEIFTTLDSYVGNKTNNTGLKVKKYFGSTEDSEIAGFYIFSQSSFSPISSRCGAIINP